MIIRYGLGSDWRTWRQSVGIVAIAAILTLLAACTPGALSRATNPLPEPVDLNRVLGTVASLRQSDPSTLRDSAAATDTDDPSQLLGWALVMTMLGEPSDKARAAELFTAYLNHPMQTPGSIALATVMLDQLRTEARLRNRLSVTIRQRDALDARLVASPKRGPKDADTRGQEDADKLTLQAVIRERDDVAGQLEALRASKQQQQVRDHALRATIRERDELTTQLEELKEIEMEIRDRKRDSNLESPEDNLK
ncbi:MAG: hypothetical protein KFB96_23340 [Thiocapsa sp.]|uniref:hypothetical protein n=1 Tax=Thiocapsa sp. TaxID=2024551 RepID=UPI001BCC2B44|nr:hypothetical protein [Thiocapsa sp.]QVL48492.1 MAG: hypothetical protein KFB96_23340 [Thiocapsa sp.]